MRSLIKHARAFSAMQYVPLPKTTLPEPLKILPFSYFQILNEFKDGEPFRNGEISHQIFIATDKYGAKYFLKDKATDRRVNTQNSDYQRFLAEKEVLAGMLARSLNGGHHSPETFIVEGRDKDDNPKYYVASKEIEHFIELPSIRLAMGINDDDPLFTVDNDGKTKIKSGQASIQVTGRILCRNVRRFLGDGDDNAKNTGLIINGKKRGTITNIDFDSCFSQILEYTAEDLAFGDAGSIISELNVPKAQKSTMLCREAVKKEVFGKIASIDSNELENFIKGCFCTTSHEKFGDKISDIIQGQKETLKIYKNAYEILLSKEQTAQKSVA